MKVLASVLIILLISGCTTHQKKDKSVGLGFIIDAITDKSPNKHRRFVILPGDTSVKPSDLYFKEFSTYVSRALQKKGYVSVRENEGPELAVLVFYGVGDARTTTYTKSSASATKITDNLTLGDEERVTYQETTYSKYLIVQNVEWNSYKRGETAPIWQTTVRSRGYNTDLRQEMPFLVAGGFEYFGTDTGRQVSSQTRLTDRDPLLRYIMGDKQPAKSSADDFVFSAKECVGSFSKDATCGNIIKEILPIGNRIKIKPTIANTSSLSWKKPTIKADCYYKKMENVDGISNTKKISLGSEVQTVEVELRPQDKKEIALDFNFTKLQFPSERKIYCDISVSDSVEIMF